MTERCGNPARRTWIGLLINRPIDLIRVDPSSHEVCGSSKSARVRVGILQPAGVGHQCDKGRLEGWRIRLAAELSNQIDRKQAGRRRGDIMELGIPVMLGAVEWMMIDNQPGLGQACEFDSHCPQSIELRAITHDRQIMLRQGAFAGIQSPRGLGLEKAAATIRRIREHQLDLLA
jgi:hypothetical protein